MSDIGSFSEYPDDFTIKVRYDGNEVEDIYKAICRLSKRDKKFDEMCKNAYEFAKKNCDLENNAKKYAKFFNDLLNNTFQEEYIDSLLDKLQELDLLDEKYVKSLLNNLI